ncbi:Wzz/FepE/Etk N-terminal domain-containing protein [Pseudomonas sp. RW10S2]|uniref:LPS O-antigen chain length determinant protein WzzB n=1 Tax=Pseudomonas sp. RW10S2 TaxID=459637 RepID=UPI0016446657|nr:Wzz/FepE/Etk N-terminal domain-containing protein [Pseudomonas sp. RW10S2]MBC3465593.1 LPS O-antigen chain length determinant protein WzzB [Pseudomonas sp. RW10S2]
MGSNRERPGEDGEIDLFELVEAIWKQKFLIVVAVLACTAVAAIYAMTAKPVYEAKIFVQPPTQNDIAQLNYGRGGKTGLSVFSVKDVYGVYLANLQSDSLRREFFRSVYLSTLTAAERQGSQDALYARFNSMLELGVANREAPDRVFLRSAQEDPVRAARWVSEYAELAGNYAKQEIIANTRADFVVLADNLDQQNNAARESARRQREDQIVQLTEALRVARSIGLEKPPIISNSLSGEISAGMDGPLTYMRGAKALEAEIDNLRSRKSDDPFIPDLRERQETINFYRALQVDSDVVQVYRQDGVVESPDAPIKPKKTLIVLIGAIVGALLGFFMAFVRYLISARRRLIQQEVG